MQTREQRNITAVPRSVFALLGIALLLQIGFRWAYTDFAPTRRALPAPPTAAALRAAGFGEAELVGKSTMLWLQSFDYQPGISIPFRELDYERVITWLRLVLELDPATQYPLLSAALVYAEVNDRPKQRQMLEFVAAEFEHDPDRRWPWMAHAVYVAKHRMDDPEYALALAERLAARTDAETIPNWARQMVIFVLEDMGELESAKVLLGGLLDSGQITDPHEQWFLSQRLAELEAAVSEEKTD